VTVADFAAHPLIKVVKVARADVEAALDAAGWLWSRRLSLWVDALVILEEDAA